MNTIIRWLMVCGLGLTGWAQAENSQTYFSGIQISKEPLPTEQFILISRSEFPQEKAVLEVETIVAAKTPLSEKTFRFDLNTSKVTVSQGSKLLGSGTFNQDFEYRIELRSSEGNRVLTSQGKFVAGVQNYEILLTGANGNPVAQWTRELKTVPATLFSELHSRLFTGWDLSHLAYGPAN